MPALDDLYIHQSQKLPIEGVKKNLRIKRLLCIVKKEENNLSLLNLTPNLVFLEFIAYALGDDLTTTVKEYPSNLRFLSFCEGFPVKYALHIKSVRTVYFRNEYLASKFLDVNPQIEKVYLSSLYSSSMILQKLQNNYKNIKIARNFKTNIERYSIAVSPSYSLTGAVYCPSSLCYRPLSPTYSPASPVYQFW